ncbi:DUF6883 domain-containing protein [Nodosilinea sp. PGN35]|uniref:DUF6883 domain-containing protein n=1 Tax=Nodosilinea sp. PGN35 TaxID=3020489 RepID=UPI0023B240ED|nr:DUF6883 domain-containing protein [Nodosilinea sp. TSF1-S3]MDF0365954.1 hypothetical protein [Nodosilinea sp. TSF1-S3]
MQLPNGHRAQLGDKLERYCLNPDHRKGKDKAALFRDRLGITLENKDVLEAALLAAALEDDAVVRSRDQYGYHYNIRFPMRTDVGEAWVLACWIIRHGEDFPRLTNTYPVRS